MRLLRPRRHDSPPETKLPEASTIYEAALERLVSSHESEAAAYLALCKLEIAAAGATHPLREQLLPVRLILVGPPSIVSTLERSAEIKGRIRQALDSSLGHSIYLAQMSVVGADVMAA
jgi:hypothetical protein